MTKEMLKKRIDTAAGRRPADLVIKNAKVVDVFGGGIIDGDIAICDGVVVGVGKYEGGEVFDAKGKFAAPGFIDSHIHVESTYLTPEEIGRLLVPRGAATIIADPHEIVNIKGLDALRYMLEATGKTALDIKYMMPSCVPATAFETAGAHVGAEDISEALSEGLVLGVGEFMDYPGVVYAADFALERLIAAHRAGAHIDGHCPSLTGNLLNAYAAAGISTDHECTTIEAMRERISRGMYVLMRQGSACQDLEVLVKGVTKENSSRCLLCSDDRQPKSILENGHIDGHLRICVRNGIDPVTAIQMATINAANCFGLHDRGAIAPGRRADIVLLQDLKDFNVTGVFIEGKLAAQDGKYLPEVTYSESPAMGSTFNVKDFSIDKLKLPLKSENVKVIDIIPGAIITGKGEAKVKLDENGHFVRDENEDIVKLAVIERHKGTGNAAVALLRGYGIKCGAVALSIAHDSHNIITVGTTDEDIHLAVQALISQNGGIILARDGKILESLPLPIGGIMCNQSAEWVDERLGAIHKTAHNELGIAGDVEPLMTLCFMALPVIPNLKMTDQGLFDVTEFNFTDIEVS